MAFALLRWSSMAQSAKVSASSCIEALERLGFDVCHREDGIAVLSRGNHMLVVPLLPEIPNAQLDALLAAAGITRAVFSRLLAVPTPTPRTSGYYEKR